MRALLRLFVVITGCLHLCGGHYGVLQMVAWTQMIVEYSGEKGIVQGAIRTFDGNHPCGLCISISESKKQEKEHPMQGARQADLEIKNLLIPEIARLDPSRPELLPTTNLPRPGNLNSLFRSDPAVPPPRQNLA